jgi:RNA polymerase sigma-70 factor (ECF subfamily)
MDHDTSLDAATDAALVGRILEGSEEALVALYQRRRRDVYLFALAMGKSANLAEDATHDVFLNVIENASRFDPAKGTVRAWLLGCARHLVIDRLRRESRWTRGVPEQTAPDADEVLAARQLGDRLHAAIANLPSEFRDVLVLCELKGLTYAETASVLQCPIGTVRSRLHRARALLAEALAPGECAQPAAADAAALHTGEVCP